MGVFLSIIYLLVAHTYNWIYIKQVQKSTKVLVFPERIPLLLWSHFSSVPIIGIFYILSNKEIKEYIYRKYLNSYFYYRISTSSCLIFFKKKSSSSVVPWNSRRAATYAIKTHTDFDRFNSTDSDVKHAWNCVQYFDPNEFESEDYVDPIMYEDPVDSLDLVDPVLYVDPVSSVDNLNYGDPLSYVEPVDHMDIQIEDIEFTIL